MYSFFKGHKNSGRAPPGKHCGPFLPLLRSGNSFSIHQEKSVEASEAAMTWHHCSAPETELILPFPWGGETQAVFVDGHSFVLQSRQNGRPLPGVQNMAPAACWAVRFINLRRACSLPSPLPTDNNWKQPQLPASRINKIRIISAFLPPVWLTSETNSSYY